MKTSAIKREDRLTQQNLRRTQTNYVSKPSQPTPMSSTITVCERESSKREREKEHVREKEREYL
jgi:hypothetical protein